MVAELPIVASAVGGIPEVIHHEETGLLIPHPDRERFVEAVKSLIGDPKKGRRLGATAREFVEKAYSLDSAVRALETTYFEMLDAGASR